MRLIALVIGFINIAFAAAKPVVTTTLAPYAYAIEMIAKDHVETVILIPENANPHIYEAKPVDLKKLSLSKLWFCSGEAIEQKIQTGVTAEKINLNQNIKLIHSHSHEHHHGKHCHHDTDLHTWTSPDNYLVQASIIKEALCKTFPELKSEFESNFLVLEKELLELKAKVTAHKSESTHLLVTHAAYAYLCRDLNLHQTSLEHDGKEAHLKHIQKIQNDFKNTASCKIFAEVQHSDQGAKRLSELLQAKIVYVNPYQKNYPKTILEILENIE